MDKRKGRGMITIPAGTIKEGDIIRITVNKERATK
jgi:hypothetical protein